MTGLFRSASERVPDPLRVLWFRKLGEARDDYRPGIAELHSLVGTTTVPDPWSFELAHFPNVR